MAKIYSIKEQDGENGMQKIITVDFSTRLLLIIFLGICGLFFAQQLKKIILFLFLSFTFMSTALPVVNRLRKLGVTKTWAIFITYMIMVIILLSIFSIIVIPLGSQIGQLITEMPTWVDRISESIRNFISTSNTTLLDNIEENIKKSITNLSTLDNFKSLTDFLGSIFSSLSFLITSIIFSIYLTIEHNSLLDFLLIKMDSDGKREIVQKLVINMESKLGHWVLGQGTVSFLSMLYTMIVLSILNIPYAMPLGIFVGLLGLVPTIGATVATLSVSLVTLLLATPVKAVVVLILLTIYQPFENSYIIPKVMANAVGLRPVVVMLGVMSAIFLAGPIGGLVAIPSIVMLRIIYEFYIDLQKLKAKGIV